MSEDPTERWGVSERAAALHADALVCDMTVNWEEELAEHHRLAVLPRYVASGFNLLSLTLVDDWTWIEGTVRHVAAQRHFFLSQPETYVLVETADDILAARAAGKLAVSFNFQGTNGLGGDIHMVEAYHRLGIRQMILAYNVRNLAADGCHEPADGGLSGYGRDLVREMGRVGMLLDLSHTGYRATMEAMELSTKPVVFSHSNAHHLRAHGRNIRDDQIKACAALGGVIGINGIGDFLGEDDASTGTFLKHIDYVAGLVGPEHVGLGIDLVYDVEGFTRFFEANKEKYWADYDEPLTAFFQPEQLPEVTEGLLARGHAESEVRGILGENYLRVVRAVWR